MLTDDQKVLLNDKLELWRRLSKEGNVELRDYHRRCAEALEAALQPRVFLNRSKGLGSKE